LKSTKNDELYLTHWKLDCFNKKKTNTRYYLSIALDEIINFLINHGTETVIIHLKEDNISSDKYPLVAKMIADYTINNSTVVSYNFKGEPKLKHWIIIIIIKTVYQHLLKHMVK